MRAHAYNIRERGNEQGLVWQEVYWKIGTLLMNRPKEFVFSHIINIVVISTVSLIIKDNTDNIFLCTFLDSDLEYK